MNTCLKHQQQYSVQMGGYCPYCGKPREHAWKREPSLLEAQQLQEQMQREAKQQWDRINRLPPYPPPFAGGGLINPNLAARQVI